MGWHKTHSSLHSQTWAGARSTHARWWPVLVSAHSRLSSGFIWTYSPKSRTGFSTEARRAAQKCFWNRERLSSSNTWKSATQGNIDLLHTHTQARQTLAACWAEAYRLCGGLCYDISTPNETKISLISSGTHSHASQTEGCFGITSSSPMVRPTPTFGRHEVPCTQSLGTEHKQDSVPLWAKKHTGQCKHTQTHIPSCM